MFKTSFLASSVLPLGSEPLFLYFLSLNSLNLSLLIIVATLGNSLGSMTTFYLGKVIPLEKALKKLSINESRFVKVSKFLEEKSLMFSFFCFLPVFGDVIAFYYGTKNLSSYRFFLFMSFGKLFRYCVLAVLFF
jgi:membrane protein YqaA with SNARE-associated domain